MNDPGLDGAVVPKPLLPACAWRRRGQPGCCSLSPPPARGEGADRQAVAPFSPARGGEGAEAGLSLPFSPACGGEGGGAGLVVSLLPRLRVENGRTAGLLLPFTPRARGEKERRRACRSLLPTCARRARTAGCCFLLPRAGRGSEGGLVVAPLLPRSRGRRCRRRMRGALLFTQAADENAGPAAPASKTYRQPHLGRLRCPLTPASPPLAGGRERRRACCSLPRGPPLRADPRKAGARQRS